MAKSLEDLAREWFYGQYKQDLGHSHYDKKYNKEYTNRIFNTGMVNTETKTEKNNKPIYIYISSVQDLSYNKLYYTVQTFNKEINKTNRELSEYLFSADKKIFSSKEEAVSYIKKYFPSSLNNIYYYEYDVLYDHIPSDEEVDKYSHLPVKERINNPSEQNKFVWLYVCIVVDTADSYCLVKLPEKEINDLLVDISSLLTNKKVIKLLNNSNDTKTFSSQREANSFLDKENKEQLPVYYYTIIQDSDSDKKSSIPDVYWVVCLDMNGKQTFAVTKNIATACPENLLASKCTHFNSLQEAIKFAQEFSLKDNIQSLVMSIKCDSNSVIHNYEIRNILPSDLEIKKQVIIMCGVSGSGKTTYVQKHYPNAYICSADLFFGKDYDFDPNKLENAHNECLKSFLKRLQENKPQICVDNTNTTIAEIAPYYALAKAFGYSVKIITTKCSLELAANRTSHKTPKYAIEKMEYNIGNSKLPKYWNVESEVIDTTWQ